MADLLINRSACKRHVLDIAARHRKHKFTRVGACVYAHLQAVVKHEIFKLVASQPSMGKTIKM